MAERGPVTEKEKPKAKESGEKETERRMKAEVAPRDLGKETGPRLVIVIIAETKDTSPRIVLSPQNISEGRPNRSLRQRRTPMVRQFPHRQ